MKILQVLPELNLAGAQVMVENLIYCLMEREHQVCVISMYSYHTPITQRLSEKNIKIYYLDKKPGFDISVVLKIRRIIKEFAPDIIHTHTYAFKYAYISSRFLYGNKIVHTIHNIASKETTKSNRKLEDKVFKKSAAQPVAISPLVKQSIIEYYRMPENVVPVIYNGISLENCIPKAGYDIANDTIKLIHLGRLQEQKNHELMIEAMKLVSAKYSNVVLYCFGIGPLQEQLEEKIAALKLKRQVVLAGLTECSYKELHDADIFLLPSKWEGMPITLIEAMGTGLPIIVTPVGGIPDMINDDVTGLVINNDASELAAAIMSLVESKTLRKRIGTQALKAATKFSAKEMCNGYEKVYQDCLNSR